MRLRNAAGLVAGALIGWIGLGGSSAWAAVKPHGLFADGMVLQRDAKVPIWGTAADGEKVTVRFEGQEVSATAQGGKWRVELNPLKAGGPAMLTIEGKDQAKVEIKDVLVGDVWVCGGQSNMEQALINTEGGKEAVAAAADDQLRLFTVPRRGSGHSEADVEGRWSRSSPESSPGFAAVAYYFGKDLRKALNVPIGLISSNVGGTEAERWTSRKALEADPRFKELAARTNVSDLHNAMIAPLQPFAIKGAIWYQGESNAGRARQYRALFAAMIKDWRDGWGQGDFPFLFVQLAPFMAIVHEPAESQWAELREAQRLTARDVPKTAMAVITDVGDEKDIHPRKKQPVGARLALAARKVAYGEDLVASGPDFDSMTVNGNKAVLRFRNVGGGLVAKDGPLTGFTVASDDRKYVNAEARIEGDTIVVSSDKVARPAAVRFGWANYPVVNLWNKAGLPASPFQTDDLGEKP